MKALKLLLESQDIDTSSLRVLFEQDGKTTFGLTLNGDDALNVWEQMYALVPKTKRWPVLLNPEVDDGQLPEEKDRSVADILKAAKTLDGRAILDEWHEKNLAYLREELARNEQEGYEEDAEHFRELLKGPKEFRGIPRDDWPDDAFPTSPFAVGRVITHGHDNRSRRVVLALMPTPHSYEVPAYMKYGQWNSNPRPEDHVAIHRYWWEQHRAKLLAMKADTIEMMVEKPPTTKKAAMRLARDQYHYCEDIVLQGTDSLEELAGGLLRGEAWYFWWD